MLSAILISRLVLRMRRMYVASIRLHLKNEEWVECTERNLITYVWAFYHSSSDHFCFDYFSRETYTKHSDGAKAFWPSVVVARTS